MWSSRTTLSLASLIGVLALASCTVEPLNARSTPAYGTSANGSESVRDALRSTEISAARYRVEQQVRNALIRGMHGSNPVTDPRYRLSVFARSFDSGVAVEPGVAAARAAQVTVSVSFSLIEIKSGKNLLGGARTGFASYNRTPQLFANQRAAREAENRAAKDVAQQIRLVVAQVYSGI